MPADMVFVIEEKPHPRFKRDGDDLLVTQRISLADALCGAELTVQSLDGRQLTISTAGEVVVPGSTKILR